jgi:Bpu10I restriction endonuclease
MLHLPTPHYDKLIACFNNSKLPDADRERVKEAQNKYQQWIQELDGVESGQHDTVENLVEITNRYKRFIELDLIFDSPENFLYRQKGQLKLDNTILEEFLPQLISKSLSSIDDSFEIGPKSTFAGLSFLSSLGNTGQGGEPTLRQKNQDFILGKKIYLKTALENVGGCRQIFVKSIEHQSPGRSIAKNMLIF